MTSDGVFVFGEEITEDKNTFFCVEGQKFLHLAQNRAQDSILKLENPLWGPEPNLLGSKGRDPLKL